MSAESFKYLITGGYVVLVYALSWIGMRRTKEFAGFSIGNKDMSPYLIGVTLAASIASTATFVINPGFVYVHGLSAYLHYGLAGSAGTIAAFLTLSRGFLRVGEANRALTLPDWIFHRYQNRRFSQYFAFINLLSITFVVLILVGCSLIMTSLFPIEQKTALVIILLFVFSYVLMGGTYAHAYTNTLQGFLMLAVALLLFAQGLPLFEGGFIAALRAVNDNYAAIYNPDSSLYFSFFSVFASGFIITFALMLQPHILTKVLYLRSEADLGRFIATTVVVGFLFTLVLFIGFFARVSGLEVSSQDAVVVEYLNHTLIGTDSSGLLLTFIMLTLLAAGMSTLDGILVSLSAMVVNDIVAPLSHNSRNGLLWSRWVLVGVGLLGMLLAWNSPPLIGLFAQKGVYGLAAASLVPMLFGVLFRQPLPLWLVFGASLIGLFGHFLLHLGVGIENPSISASYAILASLAYAFVGILALRVSGSRSKNP